MAGTVCRPVCPSVQLLQSRSIALRVVSILRMTATIATFGFLPAATRRWWKVRSTGLNQGWHVERVADRCATSIDVALPTEPAAIERVRRQADQCGNLLAPYLPPLGQQGQQGIGERGADAGHRAQQAEALDEVWLGGNQLGQTLVEQNDVGLYPGEAPLRD